MSDYVIETQNITRYFGTKVAVEQVNLNVPRGCVFALLGRNMNWMSLAGGVKVFEIHPARMTDSGMFRITFQPAPSNQMRQIVMHIVSGGSQS